MSQDLSADQLATLSEIVRLIRLGRAIRWCERQLTRLMAETGWRRDELLADGRDRFPIKVNGVCLPRFDLPARAGRVHPSRRPS